MFLNCRATKVCTQPVDQVLLKKIFMIQDPASHISMAAQKFTKRRHMHVDVMSFLDTLNGQVVSWPGILKAPQSKNEVLGGGYPVVSSFLASCKSLPG